MYPVLKIMHMLNFLDTFSMSITSLIKIIDKSEFKIKKFNKYNMNKKISLI